MPDEESPPPLPECFICTDSTPAPRKSACKCTDRYVHDACLVKMLETSEHNGCPVCATPYANVSCKSRVVGVRAQSYGIMAAVLVVASPALMWSACLTWQLYCCGSARLSMHEEQLVIAAAIAMATGGGVGIAWLGNLCSRFGPRALARSTLVRKRTVRVWATTRARPPRIGVEEFELAAALPL